MTLTELLHKPYEERQLIMFSRDISQPTTMSLLVALKEIYARVKKHPVKYFAREILFQGIQTELLSRLIMEIFKSDKSITYLPSEYAKELSLPLGNLRVGELYVGHPIDTQSQFYYPISEFHTSLHSQKSHELIRILRGLQVGHFRMKHVSGYKDTSGFWGDADAKIKKVKLKASAGFQRKTDEDMKIIWEEHTDSTEGVPKLPNNLIWYDYEEEWKLAVEELQNKPTMKIAFQYYYGDNIGVDINAGLKISNISFSAKYRKTSFQSTHWEVLIDRNNIEG